MVSSKKGIFEMNCLGQTIREIRKIKLKLTQVEMGQKLGITQALLSAYEVGKCNMNLDTILYIAQRLDLDPMKDIFIPTFAKFGITKK